MELPIPIIPRGRLDLSAADLAFGARSVFATPESRRAELERAIAREWRDHAPPADSANATGTADDHACTDVEHRDSSNAQTSRTPSSRFVFAHRARGRRVERFCCCCCRCCCSDAPG